MARKLPLAVLLAVVLGACAYATVTAPLGVDYALAPCNGCDFAGAPIEALAGGHVGRFFATQPFQGPVTLLVRAPVVAVARAVGADALWQYRLGCLICLLGAGVLAALVAGARTERRRLGAPAVAALAVGLALLLAGPVTQKALSWGHPEEVVGAMLCVAALAFAARGLPLVAGVALGLALATKQWALLAVIPALMVAREGRTPMVAVAAALAAVLLAPMLIGDPGLFLAQNLHAGVLSGAGTTTGATVTNVWFPFAHVIGTLDGPGGGAQYALPESLTELSHPLAVLVGLGLPIALWRARPGVWDLESGLLLLALLFLARCVLDPLTLSYHHAPLLAALIAYEALVRRRLPVVALLSAAALYAVGRWLVPLADPPLENGLYLAWAGLLGAYLALALRAHVRPATATAVPAPAVAL